MDVDLHACLTGDQDAWTRFVRAATPIIRAATCRAGNRGPGAALDTDDVVQAVLTRLIRDDYRLLRTFDASRASLPTWLSIVARSAAIDLFRARRPTASIADDGAIPGRDAGVSDANGGEERGSGGARSALSVVPPHLLTARQELVLTLLFDRDLSVAEVARFLDVDEQTIRSTKHKALLRLRACFGAPESTRGCEAAGTRSPSREDIEP